MKLAPFFTLIGGGTALAVVEKKQEETPVLYNTGLDAILDKSITVESYDHYRLPLDPSSGPTLEAQSYSIDLKPYLDPAKQESAVYGSYPPAWCVECDNHAQHFDGKSTMNFTVKKKTKTLIIHSRYLAYSNMVLKNEDGDSIPINMEEDLELEYIRIGTKDELPEGKYTLETEYIGFLQPNNFGLYISSYEDDKGRTHYIGSTQMEGPYARRTFPCLDEPPYKATYETTLWREKMYSWSDKEDEYYTLSNQEIKNEEVLGDWVKTEFHETVKMSTYLTAFAIVDFSSVKHKSPVSNTDHELFGKGRSYS